MPFAQLIIGPPGSGKSTYCDGMRQFLSALGRPCSVVNLDPANDRSGYPCALDVRDLVAVEAVMAEEGLGPNGATLYALEELEQVVTRLALTARGLGVVVVELLLEDAVGEAGLLLLAELQEVLALLDPAAAVLAGRIGAALVGRVAAGAARGRPTAGRASA